MSCYHGYAKRKNILKNLIHVSPQVLAAQSAHMQSQFMSGSNLEKKYNKCFYIGTYIVQARKKRVADYHKTVERYVLLKTFYK